MLYIAIHHPHMLSGRACLYTPAEEFLIAHAEERAAGDSHLRTVYSVPTVYIYHVHCTGVYCCAGVSATVLRVSRSFTAAVYDTSP